MMEVQEIKLELDLSDNLRCHCCLSMGRQLQNLGEYSEIYQKFTCNMTYYGLRQVEQIQVCWECRAMLRKVAQFQQKVTMANEAFQSSTACIYGPLSNLTSVIFNDTYTNKIYINIDINSRTEVEKLETFKDLDETDFKDLQTIEDLDNEDTCNENFNDLVLDENDSIQHDTIDSNTKLELLDSKVSKSSKPVNRWAQKRALQNKKPKFKILTNKDVDKIFRIDKMDSTALEIYLQSRRCSESYKSKDYKCETCVIGFKNKNSLLKHNNCRHNMNTGPYSCDICAAILKNKRHLSAHVRKHYIKYVCAVCGYRARSVRARKKHADRHNKVFQCLKCELMFGSRREFYQHFKAWHERFVCDHCGICFKMRYCIKDHIRKQHSAFECVPCKKRFARYNGLWLHNKIHHTAPSGGGYCVECDKHYPDVYRYRWHLANSARHKPRKKARIPCPGCDKVFSKNIYMRDHYDLVHLECYKYRCEECDKNFIRNADLVKHRRRVHEGVLPPRNKLCGHCGRGFTTNKILANHERTHTGARPHACALCPARFAQRAALAGHARTVHRAHNNAA